MDGMRTETIFSADERLSIESRTYLRSYKAITRDQAAGLLAALGEYAIRVGPEYVPDGLSDRELIEAHRMFAGFYWQHHRPVSSSGAPLSPASMRSSTEECVFDSREQKNLSLHKYIRGHEGLTKDELLSLLGAVGRYSRDAPAMKVLPYVLDGVTRTIHAHNALLAFSDRPFTVDEFAQSVRAVLRGEATQLTRPCRGPRSPTDGPG